MNILAPRLQFIRIGIILSVAFNFGLPGLSAGQNYQPVSLNPENPHYFLFRNKPTVLLTSGEHYGSVLNLDFNFKTYLETLQQDGLNLTRTFSGAYCEPAGAFNIAHNTLAPARGRFVCPWARSDIGGYPNGGNKFDLTKWNADYFSRLKEFVSEASKRGIVVEFTFFCPFYDESQWKLSPQNTKNNVNGVGPAARTNVYTLDRNGGLLAVHDAMVRKVVSELRDFDNVMYEVCNEPYFGGVTLEWQHHIADVVRDAEKGFAARHLLTQNIANEKAKIENAHPGISVFNFHYASPPDTVAMNYGLNKVIGDNETGFKGTNDTHYRMEAWQFILAGGGLFNNLDYSFTAGHEDGTFVYPKSQPGGGNPAYRHQIKVLKEFIHSFDFVKMRPEASVVKSGLPEKGRATALVAPGREYAIYLFGGPEAALGVDLAPGNYKIEWINPVSGETVKQTTLNHQGGVATINSPRYDPDVALRVVNVR
jgi:hypothetical protein